jgi:glycosyltransferase involved in cell wall biosynthesis
LVDPNSEQDIASAMLSIRSNNELKSELIEKGRQRLGCFSWETSSELIFNCLKEISRKNK